MSYGTQAFKFLATKSQRSLLRERIHHFSESQAHLARAANLHEPTGGALDVSAMSAANTRCSNTSRSFCGLTA